MKIFISADIEGITGVTDWDETELKGDSAAACAQMTAEVAAACEGAIQAGASEVWVKDSHDTGRNINAAGLPEQAQLVRGWSGHPFMTLQGLDQTFEAVLIIGYHSGAGAGKSPLEHTYSGNVWRIRLNGKEVSEFLIDAHTAAYVGVPLVFASGDRGLCEHAASLVPGITTVAVKEGSGASTINIHPSRALERIRTGVAQALQGDISRCRVPLPGHFELEVEFRSQARAYQYGFFPGVSQTGPCTVRLETRDYFDVPRFLMFSV